MNARTRAGALGAAVLCVCGAVLTAETGTNLKPLVAGPDVPKRGLAIFVR